GGMGGRVPPDEAAPVSWVGGVGAGAGRPFDLPRIRVRSGPQHRVAGRRPRFGLRQERLLVRRVPRNAPGSLRPVLRPRFLGRGL
ncbi:MAG: hypothetical protein AVDCRST_MAG02-854, partial [uncultured Rubrobacteraceae bacterium]